MRQQTNRRYLMYTHLNQTLSQLVQHHQRRFAIYRRLMTITVMARDGITHTLFFT